MFTSIINEMLEKEMLEESRLQYPDLIDVEEVANVLENMSIHYRISEEITTVNDIETSIKILEVLDASYKFIYEKSKLPFKDVLNILVDISYNKIFNYSSGNLKLYRQHYILDKMVENLLSNYEFLTKEQKTLIENNIADVKFIYDVLKSDLNQVNIENISSITIEVLKSTLTDLKYNVIIENNKILIQ